VLLTFGAGNAVGVILGGYTGHFLYKRDSRLPPIAMGCCIILGCVPMWFIINMDYGGGIHILKASFIMFLTGVLLIVPVPIERAILSNVTLPEARGRANSFLSMVDNLGKALGPFLLSTMISTMGRPTAFNLSLIGWIIGGLVSCMIYFTVKKDEDDIQSVIEEKIVRGSATTQERI
jgi:predicted MFS family arabinose efflux permease